MSLELARSLLLLLGVGLNIAVTVLNRKDRDRRERDLSPGHRPPVRYTPLTKVLAGLSWAALGGVLVLFFV